jgi:hypothetical protein
MDDKRSPLKAPPLRSPGQSVEEQRFNLIYDKVLTPSILAWVLTILAGVEWARYHYKLPPNPLAYFVGALLGIGYAAFQIWRVWPQLQQLRQARDGEKVVGQFLDHLREQGIHVFHDLQGKGFNVDHALVGPRGVFTVETKTYSKPLRGEAKITFDGEKVLVGGFAPDRDCIVQARAQADWLRNLISESTGRKVSVRPAVVYPGWYIDGPPAGVKTDVWVLNPKGLPAFISHQPEVLSPEDIKLISFHISRYVRAENL